MESRKIKNLLASGSGDRHWEQTYGYGSAGQEGEGGGYGESTTETHISIWDVQMGGNMGKPVVNSCWCLVEINIIL